MKPKFKHIRKKCFFASHPLYDAMNSICNPTGENCGVTVNYSGKTFKLDATIDTYYDKTGKPQREVMVTLHPRFGIKNRPRHVSWLRIYAIKLEPGCYIITGGAIKLTHKMGDREHTLNELSKMEQVRNFLISNQAIDADGFADFLSELS